MALTPKHLRTRRKRRVRSGAVPAELQPLVNRMTGWQRNQWARWQTEDDRAELVAPFLKPRRAS